MDGGKSVEKKLLVVGSINIDLVACANRLPAPGETILGSSFDVFNGGKGANQAVAIAKLGAQVDMIASLGTDLFTERLLSGLKTAGVDTHAVQMVAGPCGVAHISRADNGENSIIVVSGANRLLSAAYIDTHLEIVQQAKMILVQLETPLDAVIRLAEQAAETKTPLMLDPAPAIPLPEALLSRTTWLTPNETEAQILLGRVKSRSPCRRRKVAGDGGAKRSPEARVAGSLSGRTRLRCAADSRLHGKGCRHHCGRRLLQCRLRGCPHARQTTRRRRSVRGRCRSDLGHSSRCPTVSALCR